MLPRARRVTDLLPSTASPVVPKAGAKFLRGGRPSFCVAWIPPEFTENVRAGALGRPRHPLSADAAAKLCYPPASVVTPIVPLPRKAGSHRVPSLHSARPVLVAFGEEKAKLWSAAALHRFGFFAGVKRRARGSGRCARRRRREVKAARGCRTPKRRGDAVTFGYGASDQARAGTFTTLARRAPERTSGVAATAQHWYRDPARVPPRAMGAKEALAQITPVGGREAQPWLNLARARAVSRRFGPPGPKRRPSPPPGGTGAPLVRRRSSGSATRPRVRPKALGRRKRWPEWPRRAREKPASRGKDNGGALSLAASAARPKRRPSPPPGGSG